MKRILVIDLNLKDSEKIINNIYNSKLECKLYLLSSLSNNKNYSNYSIIIINFDTLTKTDLSNILIHMKVNNTLFISKNLSTVKKYKKIYNIIHINELKQYLNTNLADTKLDSLLSNFSFNKANIGYDYLRTCLQYCTENSIRNIPKISEIYSKVAKIYGNNITSKQIGWNIEKAIMNMKLNTKEEVIYNFFEFMPTPKSFIHTILYNYYKKS